MLRRMKLKTKGQSEPMPMSLEKEICSGGELCADGRIKTTSPITTSSRVSISSSSLSSSNDSVCSDEGSMAVVDSATSVTSKEVIIRAAASSPALVGTITGMDAKAITASSTVKNNTSSSITNLKVPKRARTVSTTSLLGTKRKISDSSDMTGASFGPRSMVVPSVVNIISKEEALHHLHERTQRNNTEPEMPLHLAYQYLIEYNKHLEHALKKHKGPVARVGLPTLPHTFHQPLAVITNRPRNSSTSSAEDHYEGTPDGILTLSLPTDKEQLNPIHYFVRKNIEVFVAGEEEVTAPSPGRKNAITRGQVGLRCIHCRHVNSLKRIKRAVCYPSKISRVYNCASDMKFDHFALCKHLPEKERAQFDELKAQRGSNLRRGKGGNNTAYYYYESAIKIGMVEAPNGIVLLKRRTSAGSRSLTAITATTAGT